MSEKFTKNPGALSKEERAAVTIWCAFILGISLGYSGTQTRVSEILSQAETPTLNTLTLEQARDEALARATNDNNQHYKEEEIQMIAKKLLDYDRKARKNRKPEK